MSPVRGLYGMVDTGVARAPADQLAVLLDAGCRVVQLRAKSASTADRCALTRALMPRVRAAGARLIVNDDLSAAALADGVHLGQDDAPPALARARLGAGALVGWSTHTAGQVAAACGHVDYIGFGPVFSTTSKDTGYPPRGVEALAAAVSAFGGPVVAIGGIDAASLPAVRATGAAAWAVIGAIWAAPDPAGAARFFAQAVDKA